MWECVDCDFRSMSDVAAELHLDGHPDHAGVILV